MHADVGRSDIGMGARAPRRTLRVGAGLACSEQRGRAHAECAALFRRIIWFVIGVGTYCSNCRQCLQCFGGAGVRGHPARRELGWCLLPLQWVYLLPGIGTFSQCPFTSTKNTHDGMHIVVCAVTSTHVPSINLGARQLNKVSCVKEREVR